jgi:DHA1 family bicyclomycin/chloramphenicol resistance-like MFS transporter
VTPGSSPAPSRGRRLGLLVVLAGISAFGPVTIDAYLPALPEVAGSLGVDVPAAQLTLTACLIGLAIGQLVIGPISDELGRRRPLALGLAIFILASLACAAAPSLPFLVAARLLQGLGGAAGIVIARAMVRDLFGGLEAAKVFSVLIAIVSLGPIIGPLGGALLLRFTRWDGIFLALAVFGLALLVATQLLTAETLPPENRRKGGLRGALRSYRLLLTQRRYLGFAIPGCLAFAAFFAYISASSFVYQEVFGFSPEAYALLFATNGAGLFGAAILNGRLVGRVDQASLLRFGLATLAAASAGVAVGALAGTATAVILVLLFVAVSSIGLVVANSLSLALEDERERAGSASALFGLLQFTMGALIAPLVGTAGASAVPMGIAMLATAAAAIAVRMALLRW